MNTVNDLVIACRQRDILMVADGEALRVEGPDKALTEDLLSEIKASKPDILAALCLQDETEDLREHFEERAGIMEHTAGLPRAEAELEAAKITATYARNRGYQWESLRSTLPAYPELLPEKAGPVDSLPLGVAKVAVLQGRRVLRQGVFTGEQTISSTLVEVYPVCAETSSNSAGAGDEVSKTPLKKDAKTSSNDLVRDFVTPYREKESNEVSVTSFSHNFPDFVNGPVTKSDEVNEVSQKRAEEGPGSDPSQDPEALAERAAIQRGDAP